MFHTRERRITSTEVHSYEIDFHQTMLNQKKINESIHYGSKLSVDKLQNKLEDHIQPLTCICDIWNTGFSNIDYRHL